MDDHSDTIDIPSDISMFLQELQAMVDDLRENEWIDAAAHAILRAKLLELENLAAHDLMVVAGLAFYMRTLEPPW